MSQYSYKQLPWLMALFLFAVIVVSIILGVWLRMQPCILCYVGRLWILVMLGYCCLTRLQKHVFAFLTVWLLAVLTNFYHLYLIYLAPPQTACVPWTLHHLKQGWLDKLVFVKNYALHNLSSCQSDNHLFLGIGLPFWLLLVHIITIVIFYLFIRSQRALR